LFDGIAALCGLAARNTFEGEAAMQLEQAALAYFRRHAWQLPKPYPVHIEGSVIALPPLIEAVLRDLGEGIATDQIAAALHVWITDAIAEMAFRNGAAKLAFSGGVFQNVVLIELLVQKMGGTHTLYFHKALSPNDENISLGQTALFAENIPFTG
jgi:hydrogenase maturation protein HypF